MFQFHEETGEAEARFQALNSADSPLYDMHGFGKRRGATWNFACDRLYCEARAELVVEKN